MRQPRAVTGNAADPKQVAYGKRKEKGDAERRFNLVAAQMGTYQGREFVWSMLEASGMHDNVDGPTEYVHQFLGRRRLGIDLFVEVKNQHPEAYLLMQKEAIIRASRDDQAVDAAQAEVQA